MACGCRTNSPSCLLVIFTIFNFFNILHSSQVLKGPKLANACRFSQFRCNEGSLCLETEKLCNGVQDCPHGEDEMGNHQYDCKRSTLSDECPPGEFRCRFGGCIRNEVRCNGIPDCWGGTDEAIDFCNIDPQKVRKRVKKPSSTAPSTTKITQENHLLQQTTNRYYLPVTHEPQHSSVPSAVPTTHPYGVLPSVDKIPQQPSDAVPHQMPSAPIQPGSWLDTVEADRNLEIPPTSSSSQGLLTYPPAPNLPEVPDARTDVLPSPPAQHSPTVTTPESVKTTCPIIELDLGQRVSCFQQKLAQEILCEENISPEGTRAEISCKQFWAAPETGPNRSFKLCRNGQWVGGSHDFVCELDCGTGGTAPKPYIAGGQPSEQGKWPWHAGLYDSNPPGSSAFQHICGATLITRQAVLTAAHCVTFPSTNQKRNEGSLRVYLGKYFRQPSKNNEYVQPLGVSKIIIHQKYNYAQLENDIAVLRLAEPVQITPFVHPVCMPHEDADGPYVGDEGTLTGWGSVGDRMYPDELRDAKMPVRSNRECITNSPVLANLMRETTFCAGHKNGTSACDGDSGGGLVFRDEFNVNKFKIYGIVSGGVPRPGGRGCDPNYFVAFTKVSSFRRWIDRVLDSFALLLL